MSKTRPSKWVEALGPLLNLLWIVVASLLVRFLVEYFFSPFAFYILIVLGVIVALLIARVLWKVFRPEKPPDLGLR